MGDNPLSVLQQLASNPQLITQMQGILALLSPGHGDGATGARPGGVGLEQIAALCPQPRTPQNTATTDMGAASSLMAGGLNVEPPRQQTRWPSPVATASESSNLQSRGDSKSDVGKYGVVSVERYERLMARYKELEKQSHRRQGKRSEPVVDTQRVLDLEEEVARLKRTIGHLQGVVEEKESALEKHATQHNLEVHELKKNYELKIKSLTQTHEAAVRKLVSAQELVTAARNYQTAVCANNVGGGNSVSTTSGRPLSNTVNHTRGLTTTSSGSGPNQPYTLPHPDGNAWMSATTSDDRCAPVTTKNSHSVKREREGTVSTTPTKPLKKRNPRTPSYTVADRISETDEYVKKSSPVVKKELNSPTAEAQQTCLDGMGYQPAVGSNILRAQTSYTSAACTLVEAVSNSRQQFQQQRSESVQMQPRSGAVALRQRTGGLSPVASSSGSALMATPSSRGLRRPFRPVSGASSAVGGSTRSPSPVDPKRGAVQPRYFITTSLTEKERNSVMEAIQKLGQRAVLVDNKVDEILPLNTTHIVLRGPPRSVKALCGVVSSKWLVQPSYVFDSLGAGFWLDEEVEGGLRYFPPPLRCQRFLLTMPEGVVKTMLQRVVEFGGGEVVGTKRNGSSNDQDVVVVSSGDELLRFAISRD